MRFREGTTKKGDPFLHGIVHSAIVCFKEKVNRSRVRDIVGSGLLISVARQVTRRIEGYKSHKDCVEVGLRSRKRKSKSWKPSTIRPSRPIEREGLIKSYVREGFGLLSRVSGSIASTLEHK